jgi:hypothetical protein
MKNLPLTNTYYYLTFSLFYSQFIERIAYFTHYLSSGVQIGKQIMYISASKHYSSKFYK